MSRINAMYVHVPFCKNICTYCDFTKLFYSFSYEERYLNALFDEIKKHKPNKCRTIYIGGGTPSVLSEEGLEKLLSFLSQYLTKNKYEFTIEVNPETISEKKIQIFKKYGVNRISIGVEANSEYMLSFLGRKHTYSDIQKCIMLLNKYAIDNYSFDFIYGVNGMSIDDIKRDLDLVDEFAPPHLSFYSLILENNTCLKARKYQEMDEDIVVEQYEYIFKELQKRKYKQYEVSNYCKSGYQSKHNLVYWKNKEYYGFGLGASGFVCDYRYINTKNINKYISGVLSREYETVSLEDRRVEYIMLGLRLVKGISLKEYKKLFGMDLLEIKKKEISKLEKEKLIKISKNRLTTTHQGMLLLDKVILDLI